MAVPISTTRVAREVPHGLARALLCAQGVASSSVEATARALALLLTESGPGPLPRPVVLSGDEGAARCGFERRTWWIVKRRLLALGHLVASAGGQAPSGSHGGRGRKGTYCVSPATFARFLEGREAWVAGLEVEDLHDHLVARGLRSLPGGAPPALLRWREKAQHLRVARSGGAWLRDETVMRSGETVMPAQKTVMRLRETVMRSGETVMPSSRETVMPTSVSSTSLLSGESFQTSNVLEFLGERTAESPGAELGEPGEGPETAATAHAPDDGAHPRFATPGSRTHPCFPEDRRARQEPETPAPRRSERRAHHRFSRTAPGDAGAHHCFVDDAARGPVATAPGPGDDSLAWLEARVLESRASRGAEAPGSARASRGTPRAREIVELLRREARGRVREALARALDRALVLERFEACVDRRERLALLRALPRRRRSVGRRAPGPAPAGSDAVHDAPEVARLSPAPGPRAPDAAPPSLAPSSPGPSSAPPPSPSSPMAGSPPSPPPPAGARGDRRRARAPHPLWSFDDEPEKREVGSEVAAILERANRDFGATFDVERSRRDTLLYPYEVVRGAVANVLLKEARGYRFTNPGAVLWDAITLPSYRLEEFAVANLEEVRERCRGAWADRPAAASPPVPPPSPPGETRDADRGEGERERKRAEALRALFASLPEAEQQEIDRRAREVAAAGFLGRGSPFDEQVLALRVHRAREEILAREHGG